MQKVLSVTLAGWAAALVTAAPAFAMEASRFRGVALLSTPTAEATEVKVAGVTWRCDGQTCTGSGPAYSGLDDVIKECGKLSVAVGPLQGFKSRGRAVAGGRLDRCNRRARPGDPAALVAQAR